MELINRIVAFLGSVLPYLFAAVMISAVYGYFSAEEYDDDSVTFTVSCRNVRNDREHYPSSIVDHCDRMLTTQGKQ